MRKEIYETKCWSEIYRLRADFSQAGCPIEQESGEYGGWDSTPMQVADYRHSPELAMRAMLEDSARAGGEITEDVEQMIADAVKSMRIAPADEND